MKESTRTRMGREKGRLHKGRERKGRRTSTSLRPYNQTVSLNNNNYYYVLLLGNNRNITINCRNYNNY